MTARRVDALAADVAEAELAADVAARRADLAAGLVPPNVRRALFAHEIRARTNFAELEGEIARNAARIAERIAADRARFLALLIADLRRAAARPGPATPVERIGQRLYAIDGPAAIDGAAGLLADAQRFHRGRLTVGVDQAARRVAAEARSQGIPVADGIAAKLDPVADHQLDLLAQRIALQPHDDLVRALRDAVVEEPKDFVGPDELLDRLEARARQLSSRPLEQYADTAAAQADVMGRAAAAQALPAPKEIYASELLDRSTCGPCSLVDGRRYPTLAEARLDYPHGTYHRCQGGLRCRGTLVFVWAEEADPTLPTAGDTVGLPPRPDVDRTPPGRTIDDDLGLADTDKRSLAFSDPRAVVDANRRAGAFWSYYFEFQRPIRQAVLNVEAGMPALRGVDLSEAERFVRETLDVGAAARAYNVNDLRADIEAAARYLVNRVRRAEPTTYRLVRGMNIDGAVNANRFRVGQVWDVDVWSWTTQPDEAARYATGAGTPIVLELLPGARAARISDDFPGKMASSQEHLTIGRIEVVSSHVDGGVIWVVGRLLP